MKTLIKALMILLVLIVLPLAVSAEETPEQYAAAFGNYTMTEINRVMERKGTFTPNVLTDNSQKESLPKDANGRYIVPDGAVVLGSDGEGSSTYILPQDDVTVLHASSSGGLKITRQAPDPSMDQDEQQLQFRLDGVNSDLQLQEGQKALVIVGENDFSIGAVHSFSNGLLTLKKQSETDHTLFTYAKSFHLTIDDTTARIPLEDIELPL